MGKNPEWTRAFRVSWDQQYVQGLYVTEREALHEASGVVFGSGLVALDSGATYESLDELHGLLEQVGEMELEWVDVDRWWWRRIATSLFLVCIVGVILAAWHFQWLACPDLVYILMLYVWFALCCWHVVLLHRAFQAKPFFERGV